MRKATVFGLIWLTVFLILILGVEASLILLQDQKPTSTGPLLMDRTIIHWNFDVMGNYTKNTTWDIEFDDLFPGDSGEYIVFPEFFTREEWEMGGSVGQFEIWVFMYLNGVYQLGHRHTFEMAGPGGAGYVEWLGGEDRLDHFSNATPKSSGNLFEVRLSFSSNMSEFGDGWIDIIAGPLLLYANRSPSSNHVVIVPLMSAILALPSAYVILAIFQRMREEPPQKRGRR